jgi:SNF family Na+-dependent transporter
MMATPIEKLREACLKRGVSGIKTIGKLVIIPFLLLLLVAVIRSVKRLVSALLQCILTEFEIH